MINRHLLLSAVSAGIAATEMAAEAQPDDKWPAEPTAIVQKVFFYGGEFPCSETIAFH